MDIKAIKEKRDNLSREISKLITTFSKETELTITDIDLLQIKSLALVEPDCYRVTIGIKL